MSLETQFQSAADQVRKFSKKPSDSDMLEIYALYKQATSGDVNTPKPGDATGKAKWDAWSSKKGLDSNAAKEKYIAKVQILAPKFA
ncbi:putative acyl-CoA-binding protein [Cylas formicarius]|uniref:putative acyl-CoA-binding protein n=1 Tax=Cylas formicarius TaxID=197179 RepID=UPI002958AEC6|nr:putative acyl-CoA-binding protein [Cylas formicarius]